MWVGVVVRPTDRVLPRSCDRNGRETASSGRAPPVDDDEEEGDEDETEPVKMLEEIGSFDEVVVWGHEQVPAEDDVFVRGMEEWIGFAEAMHSVEDGRAPADAEGEAKV